MNFDYVLIASHSTSAQRGRRRPPPRPSPLSSRWRGATSASGRACRGRRRSPRGSRRRCQHPADGRVTKGWGPESEAVAFSNSLLFASFPPAWLTETQDKARTDREKEICSGSGRRTPAARGPRSPWRRSSARAWPPRSRSSRSRPRGRIPIRASWGGVQGVPRGVFAASQEVL